MNVLLGLFSLLASYLLFLSEISHLRLTVHGGYNNEQVPDIVFVRAACGR